MTETPYTETEALLAVMNDDWDRCVELLAGMLPGELRRFEDQAYRLHQLIGSYGRQRRMQTRAEAQQQPIISVPEGTELIRLRQVI